MTARPGRDARHSRMSWSPLIGRPDLLVDLHEGVAEFLKLAELGDLPFRLPHGHGRGQGFGDCLALDLIGETQIGTVPGIAGTGAMAGGLAATPDDAGNRTGAQIGRASCRERVFTAV